MLFVAPFGLAHWGLDHLDVAVHSDMRVSLEGLTKHRLRLLTIAIDDHHRVNRFILFVAGFR
jgi:hypothetical protein